MESQAKVLVNFRNPNEKLTRYSFPSKILEYIASGSMVISTRLIGIPEEYFKYVIPVNLDDNKEVLSTLRMVLQLSSEEYVSKCREAIEFVQNFKNRDFQTKRIITFLNCV